ncbi:MAG TPA: hypothetical protein VGA52_02905 [Anaerolineales bacterium]
MTYKLHALLALLCVLLLAACAPAADPLPMSENLPTPSDTSPVEGSPPPGGGPQLPVQPVDDPVPGITSAMVSDLAAMLALAEDAVVVESVDHVIWPSAALGCPLPTVDYAQVETPGYLVILRANGAPYEYHTDEAGRYILCAGGQPFLPFLPIKPGDIDDGRPWMPAGTPPPGDPEPIY